MQHLATFLGFNQRILSPGVTLAAPPGVFAGAPAEATEALAACAIETVGDLARSTLFANAVKIHAIRYYGCLRTCDDAG